MDSLTLNDRNFFDLQFSRLIAVLEEGRRKGDRSLAIQEESMALMKSLLPLTTAPSQTPAGTPASQSGAAVTVSTTPTATPSQSATAEPESGVVGHDSWCVEPRSWTSLVAFWDHMETAIKKYKTLWRCTGCRALRLDGQIHVPAVDTERLTSQNKPSSTSSETSQGESGRSTSKNFAEHERDIAEAKAQRYREALDRLLQGENQQVVVADLQAALADTAETGAGK